MADLTTTTANASPLPGSHVEGFNAGGSGALLDTVYVASDGDVEQADGSVAGTADAIGVVVGIVDGKTSFVAGDRVQVLVWGPIAGFSGMTPGDVLYQSDTAGKVADAAGTVSHKIGRARTATILFVQPPITGA